MIILNLSSTEEARELGRTCDPAMLSKLLEAREVLIRFSRQAQLEQKLSLAMDYAFRAQLFREAVEVLESRKGGISHGSCC